MKKTISLFVILLLGNVFALAQVPDSSSVDDPPSYTEPIPEAPFEFNLQNASLSTDIANYLNKSLSHYTAYDFNYAKLDSMLVYNPYAVEFRLKGDFGNELYILQRNDLRARNYTRTTTDVDGQTIFVTTRDSTDSVTVRTLKGSVNHDRDIVSRFGIFPDNLMALKWDTREQTAYMYISLQTFIKLNGSDFVTSANPLIRFNVGDYIAQSNKICLEVNDLINDPPPPVEERGYFEKCTPRFLTIAAEGDKQWVDTWGNYSESVILLLTSMSECIYTHYFNVSFIVSNINLLTSNPSSYNTTDGHQILYAFQNNWNSHHTNIDRDVALLFTGRNNYTYNGAGVGGVAFTGSLCNTGLSYGVITMDNTMVRKISHELGHVFGSLHEEDYGTTCGGNYVPIMCAVTSTYYPLYFSTQTRSVILNFINDHANCLNDYANTSTTTDIVKSWTNNRNLKWLASWYMQQGDKMLAGNFDGENDDEEIFFASPDRSWVGIMDFSCDQGTDWYHLWGNNGNRSFGCWYRNYGDEYYSGDFDGDGKDEILSRTDNGSWGQIKEYTPSNWSWKERWSNNGNNNPMGYWYMGRGDVFTIGDFDGDGKDEILCVNPPNGWAQLVKLTPAANGWYTPETVWDNSGSGWIGGLEIDEIVFYFKGKMRTTAKDELYAFIAQGSTTFSAIMRYSGSGWTLTGGQGLGTSFNTVNITPASYTYHMMTGNLDNDDYSEYLASSNTWIATYDYSAGGPGMQLNWSNSGASSFSDWNLNQNARFFLVKAAPTAPDQLLTIQYIKKHSGWLFWYDEWYEANLASMYRAKFPNQNMKPAFGQGEDNVLNIWKNGDIVVYPNPVADNLYIDLDVDKIKNPKMVVSDLTGRIITQEQLKSYRNMISLKHLASGLYIVQVTADNHKTLTTKIVKR